MSGSRHALYFAPEDGSALADFGWRWLGRQPASAALLPLPDIGLDPPAQAEVVAEARRYGFHATLKPPFHLAEGTDRTQLHAAAEIFAAGRAPFTLPPFVLDELHGFLALRPERRSPALVGLADDCVRLFDRFRAPAGAEERKKRLAQPLTERQRRYVDLWGYPYVFEDFRFHMTLTCRLDEPIRAVYRALLEKRIGPVLAEPVAFRSLCLFEQVEAGSPFVLVRRFPFGG